MLDCHIHIERGGYTVNWISRFVETVVQKGLDEIWLLEHCYRFSKFVQMYNGVCAASDYIEQWFLRKAGVHKLEDYIWLIDKVRRESWPVKIKFGLEVCYFKEYENLVYNETKGKEFDFLVGSVHFINNFAYDHKPEHWKNVDVDIAYQQYFETSIDLAKSGVYNGIAHPDCIKLFGHIPSFSLLGHYDKLATALAENNMYAEQSSGSYRRCPATAGVGMNEDLIKALKKHNVEIQTASDAHSPDDVGLHIRQLEALLEKQHSTL